MTKKKWKPKVGERYWFIYLGECGLLVHDGNNYQMTWHKNLFKIGNVFKTKKDAQLKLAEIKRILKQ